MSEERFWNTDESISTAKFAALDGAVTMRQAGRIFRLDSAPPKADDINYYIISAIRTKKIRPARFERATHCLEGSCSIQLSYGRIN